MSTRSLASSCRRHTTASGVRSLLYRGLATEVPNPANTSSPPPPSPVPRPKKPPKPTLHTSLILNRSPLITKTPSTFERAYYAYQQRIQRSLHNPFPYSFYFKPGSLLEAKFNLQERFRERRMFGKGFGADGKEAPGAELSVEDVERMGQQEEEVSFVGRRNEADESGDEKSLERFGQRNLYLVVRGEEAWKFPDGLVKDGELLHEAAKRDMDEQLGVHMDTWIVSRQPIGLYESFPPMPPADSTATPKTCHFFYKAHIMAGQVRPASQRGLTDFAWLVKEEIEGRFEKQYWEGVKDMLSDF